MITLRFHASVAKDPDHPEWNEDYFASDGESPTKKCALSDGASVSFSPQTWARRLVHNYLENTTVDRKWLLSAQAALDAQYGRSTFDLLDDIGVSEQGSFASLLGLSSDDEERTLLVTAIGDSVLAILDPTAEAVLQTFPYTTSAQFQESPLLVPSLPRHNSSVFSDEVAHQFTLIKRAEELSGCTLVLMTDAIGAWFLKSVEEQDGNWKRLLGMRTPDALHQFVTLEREAHRLRIDDTTLVVLDYAIS